MRRYRLRLACLALGSLVAVAAAEAQQGGSAIRGRVTDQQQGILPGVAIVVTHAESGTIRETVTGADGTFLVPGLVPGPYRIAAAAPGLQPADAGEPRRCGSASTLQVDLALRVGAIEENVTVTAEAPQVDLTSAQVGGNVTAGEIDEPAVGLAQLHRPRGAAARRGLQRGGRLLVRQRHHQRPARQRRGVPDGRRQQQRRPARRQLGRAGAAAARIDSGVPGRHQPVRRRVRRRHRRRRQRGHQAGHQRAGTAARSATSPTRR